MPNKMIPKECKRLAEVDFPIAVVSKHSAREKSIRHGHPSTLHLWWARRPLAACRAMMLGLLLPDPCDPYCPKDFKIKARELLPKVQGIPGPNDLDLRKGLLKFIGDFSNWDLSTNQTYLEVSRGLVKAAHPEETPLVVDPFAGGGSIPLEALRLGCEAFASDLNPVACLILKVMLEDIPRHGPELADELRRVGKEIKEATKKELAEFYPTDPDGSKPIAYLWARTVKCESPNCGAEIPLLRSFWLCKNTNRKQALRYKVVRPGGKVPSVEFEIFKPEKEIEVQGGTITRAKATCPCCNSVLAPERVRAQLSAQRGGADAVFDEAGNRTGGALLLSVVTLKLGEQGRNYRLPTTQDYGAVRKAINAFSRLSAAKLSSGLSLVPNEFLPPKNTNCFRIPNYGMKEWKDISTSRQKVALVTLSQKARDLTNLGQPAPLTLKESFALAVSRCSDFNSSLNSWASGGEFVRSTFARQALSMVWDFCEVMPLTTESGGFEGALNWVALVIDKLRGIMGNKGQVQEADACASPLPDEVTTVWFTDPPYYDAVGYAELSDFFFIWLKRALINHPFLRDPFDQKNPLTPKLPECVQDENYQSIDGKPKDRTFFEKTMGYAFTEGRRVTKNEGLGCVVFAHKTTEGWEALLSGMIQGGWTITGSWPIATERPGRLRSQESAALATSIHLVCRPRAEDAQVGDWGDVLRELPKRVGDWMERLQSEGVRGADLVFACIGPALEIFSRYSKVETAEGREVGLPEYLEKVWEVVGRIALEQVLGTPEAKARNSTAGALEEDARLTALFLWTLQSTNGEAPSPPSPQPSPRGRGNFRGASPTEGRGGEMRSSPTQWRGEKSEDSPVGERGSVEEDEEEDEEETGRDAGSTKKKQGYSLIFDVVRRFAQPLGIHLPEWEGRVIETEKGVVRLLSVKERARQLFGEEGVSVAGNRIEEQARRDPQMEFDFAATAERAIPEIKTRRPKKKKEVTAEASVKAGVTTTLDRVHAGMLLQSNGQTNALRALLKAEQERGPDFIRLANALSALYPKESEEKRLLDAMLLAMPRS